MRGVGKIESGVDVAAAVGQINGKVQRQGVLHAIVLNCRAHGVFVAVHRRVWEAHRYDFKTYDGFHGYDLDFTRRASDAGMRFAVPLDLTLLHRSTGRYGGDWRRYMSRTTNEVFRRELGFSERLAGVYSYMYGNHGRTPEHSPFAFHAVNLYHYRYGAYYPVGGPAQVAAAIVPIIEAAGGQLAVSTPAERIVVENGRAVGVKLADGTEFGR